MIVTDIKIAVKSLRSTRMRTALTILGMVIGVASVTLVLALGEGTKQAIQIQSGKLGPNSLTIRSGKAVRDLEGNILSYNFLAALGTSTISLADLNVIQQVPHVDAAPIMSIIGDVSTSSKRGSGNEETIIATTVDLARVMGLTLRVGSFVDTTAQSNTVILGNSLAQTLLGSDSTIGQTVYLRGQMFTVIGILNPYDIPPNLNNPFDLNEAAYISLASGQVFNQGTVQIQQINAHVNDNTKVKTAISQIRQQLLKNHAGEEDFSVLQPSDTVKTVNNLLKILTLLTSSVASISLIVGGIGIMNIMLVSVTERTREIGIRKTVGATNAQVLRQFVIEGLIMSLMGGLIGVLLAYALAYGIGLFFGLMPVVTVGTILIAIVMSTVIGLVFGLTPAIKAARKNPIEALRVYQ